MDVKNLLEIIEAIKVAGVAGKEIAKDGIDISDLPKALELIKKYDMFVAAVSDAKVAIDEVKDIDSEEAVVVVVALMAALKAIKTA